VRGDAVFIQRAGLAMRQNIARGALHRRIGGAQQVIGIDHDVYAMGRQLFFGVLSYVVGTTDHRSFD
jgi:hypothetical protein